MIKATDIKSVFPTLTQKNPVWFHSDEKVNIPVGSHKSDRFKFNNPICEVCNTNRTAQHDKSWEKVSAHLKQYDLEVRGTLNIRLAKIFRDKIYTNALNVHLYFIKLFGCRIVESEIPIDTSTFSDSIMTNTPNPYLFLRFKKAIGSREKMLSLSPVHIKQKGSETVVAAWMYTVGQINVELLYAPSGACNDFLKKSFNPIHQYKVLRVYDFETEDI
ncbi:MAG: hypothetical protein B6D73_14275 [gamma proteobacterium symbiont of Stewartia floridana]|nr:MAG: hypothetical protein B6D73_14275 [gamma proteobacterium symbiont of Stewartia floridana]